MVKGAKVYDPRPDSTFTGAWGTGSGAHRSGTPSTWAWSANPALCWAWYLMETTVGRSVSAASIDWNSVAVAADICDEAVDIPGPSTEERYTCNGVLFADADPAENLGAILGCMLGQMQHIGGEYYVQAGAYITPTETIAANEIVEAISVQTVAPKTDRFNQVRYRYVSAALRYTETEAFHVNDTTTRTNRDDGEVLSIDTGNPLVNSETQAQRLAFLMLGQNTQMHRLTATVNWRGMRITPGDGVSVTFSPVGYSSKTMRCDGISYDRERGFTVLLREDSASAWADPEIADYQSRPDPNAITLGDLTVFAPTALAATAVSEGIRVTWSTVAYLVPTQVYASATSAWSGASLVAEIQGTEFLHNLASDTVRYYWVRSKIGQFTSVRNPDSNTSTVTATAGRVQYAGLGPSQNDLDNARTVVPTAPQTQIWRSDSAGVGPSGNPSVVLTARFNRNGSEIATYPVTFQLTSASGTIARTLGTATGATPSASPSGARPVPVAVTITHTASNQKSYLSASWTDESSIASGGGGITK